MGVKDAFLKVKRIDNYEISPLERIRNFDEFHSMLDAETRKVQASRCMNCGIPYCGYGKPIERMTVGCPLHNLCPEFNDALCKGDYDLALQRLLLRNPFPEFTSRVCPALCEKACVAGLNFEPVSTKDNEYEIIEKGFEKGLLKPAPFISNGKRIAVVGSGPSGLACADYLNQHGYEVTVYEKKDRPGGLLMYGIPNMKLEKKIIERRINLLEKNGIVFELNQFIQDKEKADQLLKENDAVILACGSETPRSLNVSNEDANGVYYAVDFLSRTTKSLLDKEVFEINAKDKNVVIVGGGDTGNDCVGTCIRMGCKTVIQLEMMGEPPLVRAQNNPWPTWPLIKKTDYGQMEAIELFKKDPRIYNTTIDSIETENDMITSVTIVQVEKKMVDGKVSFVKKEETKKKIECDLLLIAAGFIGYNDQLTKAFDLKNNRGRVVSDTYHVHDNLFVCGDMESGQSLVVKAMASGIECGRQIMKYLDGEEAE